MPQVDRGFELKQVQGVIGLYGHDNQHIDLLFLGIARNTMSALHYRDRIANAPPGATAA